jgi:rod shape-determining protein MreC
MGIWQRHKRFDSSGSRGGKLHPAVFLGVTLLLSMSLGVLHNYWDSAGVANPVLSTTRTLLYPFQVASVNLRNSVTNLWNGFATGPRLVDENRELQAEVARLREENALLRSEAAEAVRLRETLEFTTKKPATPIVSRIIGLLPSPHFDTIILDKGSQHGIKKRAVVRTPIGMVGQVVESNPLSAHVLLLSDIKSRVHVVVCRDGKPLGYYGIVRGGGRDTPIQVMYLKREDDVRPGDTIISSGFGGVIPPDIPIGTITSVKEDSTNYLKTGQITPFAPQPGNLREVLVAR